MKKFTKPFESEIALGLRIRDARVERGLSVTAFSAAGGFHRSTVLKWESGHVRPSPETLQVIADFLRIDFLLLRDGPEKWARTLASVRKPVDPHAETAVVGYDEAMAAAAKALPAGDPTEEKRKKYARFHLAPKPGEKHPRPAAAVRRVISAPPRCSSPPKLAPDVQAGLERWAQKVVDYRLLKPVEDPGLGDDVGDDFHEMLMRGLGRR